MANIGFLLRTPPESVFLRIWENAPQSEDLDIENSFILEQLSTPLPNPITKKGIQQLFPEGMIPHQKAIHAQLITTQAIYEKVMEAIQSCPENCGFLTSLVMPIRTNNWKNFCKDFFFPTWMNSRKIPGDKFAVFIDTVIGGAYMIALDLATLILRIITLPFRYFYNCKHSKENNLLYKFLTEDARVKKEALKADYIFLELATPFGYGKFQLNFIDLPHSIFRAQYTYSGDIREDPWKETISLKEAEESPLLLIEK